MGNSKTANAQRRVPSSLSKVSTPPSVTRPGKTPKTSKIICLKLLSASLARYPHEKPARKPAQPKPAPPSIPTPTPSNEKAKSAAVKSEPKTPPAPSQPEIPDDPAENMSQKPTTGPKTGMKRELGEGVDDSAKSKARPGPKKRQKL